MKALISIIFLLITFTCFAQDDDNDKSKQGDSKFKRIRQIFSEDGDTSDLKFNGNWAGLEVGFNNYLNSEKSFNLEGSDEFMNLKTFRSRVVNINFLEFNIPLYKKTFGITTGSGLEINNFCFSRNIRLLTDSVHLFYQTDTVRKFIKTKLTAIYLAFPILFEFQSLVGKKNKPVYFSIGAVGEICIDSYTQLLFKENIDDYSREIKYRVRDNYYLSPYRYGLTARVGYRFFKLFVNYSLTPLFFKGYAPELYPLSIGIGLINL